MAAAALCLLLTVIPRASGENIFVEFFKRVREDVVAFFRADEEDNRHIPDDVIEHPGLEELRQTVEEYVISTPVVPSWIPEEYELIEIITKTYPSKTRVCACYETDDKTLEIAYDIYGVSVTTEFHKDNTKYVKFEAGGIKHYSHKKDPYMR